MSWTVNIDLIKDWLDEQDLDIAIDIGSAIDKLREEGPNLGRPMVDVIHGSRLHNLKELRPYTRAGTEVRILFIFDPLRSAVFLVAGDKSAGKSVTRKWNGWYRRAIPQAEKVYRQYLKERGL